MKAYVASSALSTMSAAATMPMPPARTWPCARTTTGLGSVTMRRCSSTSTPAACSMPSLLASERSAPLQNVRPSARISTTLDVVVGLGAVQAVVQLGDQLARQRVAVVLAVEHQRRDVVVDA